MRPTGPPPIRMSDPSDKSSMHTQGGGRPPGASGMGLGLGIGLAAGVGGALVLGVVGVVGIAVWRGPAKSRAAAVATQSTVTVPTVAHPVTDRPSAAAPV